MSLASPNTIVDSTGSLTLHRFESTIPKIDADPVLLVPSIINRAYIFDLSKKRSLAAHLLSQGLDVYLIDWGTPSRLDARLGLADYSLRMIRRCLKSVSKATGRTVQLFGYCLGGTFSLIASSQSYPEISSLITLATPVDLSDPGSMKLLTHDLPLDFQKLGRGFPIIPGEALWSAFQSLDPTGLARKYQRASEAKDQAYIERFLELERWLNDPVPMSARVVNDIVTRLYQQNALAKSSLILRGRRITLSQGRIPVLNLMAQKDTIVPIAASQGLDQLWGGPVENHIFSGGHLGVCVGSRAPKNMWSVASQWLSTSKEVCHV